MKKQTQQLCTGCNKRAADKKFDFVTEDLNGGGIVISGRCAKYGIEFKKWITKKVAGAKQKPDVQ